jgi:ribosomal protein L31
MVVIDAEKHKLNYKKSFDDNGIGALKKKYQGSEKSGAATLLSKSKAEYRIPERKESYRIDPLTGKKIYTTTGATYTDKKGRVLPRMTISTQMAEADDAFKLSSGTVKENIYATYANKLKSMANAARKVFINTEGMKYSPSASKVYTEEVKSLKAKLSLALRNAPLERKAQLLANKYVQMKKEAYPEMTKAMLKKIRGQAIIEARSRVGAKKVSVDVSQKEWHAIQSGAVSNNTLMKILENTNIDVIKQYAMPRTTVSVSASKLQKAKAMLNSGYTQAEVAQSIGVSTSTLTKALK